MGVFKKKSSSSKVKAGKITHADENRLKYRSENIHDPVLSAVNEAQPFEEAAYHERNPSSLSEGRMADVFGNTIINPDVSNPARSRDERPLDTIRAFEYSITGDATYKQQLETPQLGWRVREDFPMFSTNPYGAQTAPQNGEYSDYGNVGYNGASSSSARHAEQAVYQAPRKKESKKKKRGFLGMGKKKK